MSGPEPKPEPENREASEPSGTGATLLTILAVVTAVVVGLVLYLKVGRPEAARPTGAAGDLVAELEKLGHAKAVKTVTDACRSGQTCDCRQASARAALDANLHALALAVLAGDEACGKQPTSQGMAAEAAARAGQADAVARAKQVLAQSPNDPFATYALAHASYAKGDIGTTLQEANQALERGRGAPAELLLGLVSFRGSDLAGAQARFQNMLKLDPDDVDALYNLALIAQQQNRYRDAREGYLRVLKLAPGYLDARYNLGVLTQSVGATGEARHHLEELERAAPPGDVRVTKLQTLLAAPAPSAPGVVSGAPAAPPR